MVNKFQEATNKYRETYKACSNCQEAFVFNVLFHKMQLHFPEYQKPNYKEAETTEYLEAASKNLFVIVGS